jgi:NAD(P)-dependent dehydrogenase (short-subunit alcohol dehydrogenase family)
VLLAGADSPVARDVARALSLDGASVLAADPHPARLTALERDLGLYGVSVETCDIDLFSVAEVRLWEDVLRAFGRLPHLIVCCCGHAGAACPGRIVGDMLRPPLFLHVEPPRTGALDRTLVKLKHPSLGSLLRRGPGDGLFNPRGVSPYVHIGSQLFSVRRGFADIQRAA